MANSIYSQVGTKGISLHDSEQPGKRWAVLIGVNDYMESSIADLTKARSDAKSMSEYLQKKGEFDYIFTMTDDLDFRDPLFPTKANIEAKVNAIAGEAQPNDMILIFFSGHGTYNTDQSVAITTTTSGATLYYTTDGSTPTTSSTQYTSAISVAGNGTNTTIKAIAVKSGMANSVEVSGTWTIGYDTVAALTFSPSAGTYNTDQSVTISTTTSGATIYYTLDGSTPTTSSTQYTGAISVAGNGTTRTIKAIAVKSGMVNSAVVSGTWIITYESVDLWNGIVAYYPFNGNAKDESGVNNNHGTVSGGATLATDKFGTTNKAYSFDGTVNGYITSSTGSTLSVANVTLSAWMSIAGQGTSFPRLVAVGPTGVTTQRYGLALSPLATPRSFYFIPHSPSTVGSVASIGKLNNDSVWHHLIAVFDGTNVKLYLDGGIDINQSTTGSLAAISVGILQIGRSDDAINDFFNGKLDDIRIYNRALNATEVLSLYQNSNTAPTAGNSGTITTSNITSTSLTLN